MNGLGTGNPLNQLQKSVDRSYAKKLLRHTIIESILFTVNCEILFIRYIFPFSGILVGKKIETPHDELTYKIIGCAMAVHREYGSGLREDTYQRDLEAHLAERGLDFEAQRLYEVSDSGQGETLIGYYIPDFVVAEQVIVEIKALRGLDNSHLAQVIGYLAVSGCSVGLLVNYGRRSLEWKRILPPKDVAECQVNRQWLWVPDWLREED